MSTTVKELQDIFAEGMNQDEIYINNDNLFADVWHMYDTFRTKLSI